MRNQSNQSNRFRSGHCLALETLENRQLMDAAGLLTNGFTAIDDSFHEATYDQELRTNESRDIANKIATFDAPSNSMSDGPGAKDEQPKSPAKNHLPRPLPPKTPDGVCRLLRDPKEEESGGTGRRLTDPDKISKAITELNDKITGLETDIERLEQKIKEDGLGSGGIEFARAYQTNLKALRDGLIQQLDVLTIDQAIAEIDQDLEQPYDELSGRLAAGILEDDCGEKPDGESDTESDGFLEEFIEALESDRRELSVLRKRLVNANR